MSAFKNATQEYFKQSAKGYRADYSEVGEDLLNISPPIGSKFGMLDRAGDELKFDKTAPCTPNPLKNESVIEPNAYVFDLSTVFSQPGCDGNGDL